MTNATIKQLDLVEQQFNQVAAFLAGGDAPQLQTAAATLHALSLDLARLLQTRGVGRGSFVGLRLPRGLGAYTALLAILKAGAAYVPLDPEFPGARVRTVEVLFTAPVDPSAYMVDGVADLRVEGHVHHVTRAGDPGPLLARLGALAPADITIEAARLEDVFRALYLEGDA